MYTKDYSENFYSNLIISDEIMVHLFAQLRGEEGNFERRKGSLKFKICEIRRSSGFSPFILYYFNEQKTENVSRFFKVCHLVIC